MKRQIRIGFYSGLILSSLATLSFADSISDMAILKKIKLIPESRFQISAGTTTLAAESAELGTMTPASEYHKGVIIGIVERHTESRKSSNGTFLLKVTANEIISAIGEHGGKSELIDSGGKTISSAPIIIDVFSVNLPTESGWKSSVFTGEIAFEDMSMSKGFDGAAARGDWWCWNGTHIKGAIPK